MQTVILKNKISTERKRVVVGSDEHRDLLAEVDTGGKPRWKVLEGETAPNTFKAVQQRFPTPGEIGQGAGVAADLPPEELKKLQNPDRNEQRRLRRENRRVGKVA